jgi:hypothetical protein
MRHDGCGGLPGLILAKPPVPAITDNAQARDCARTIAGWKSLPLRPVKPAPRLRRVR